MKNFTRIVISTSLTLMMTVNAYSQQVFNKSSVGIGTTTPQQKLEIAGTVNTIRIDGLTAGGTYNPLVSGATSTSNLVYVNNATGDFYAMPSGANGTVMVISATGVPTWTTSAAAANAWQLTGNTISTTYGTNYIGTTASGMPLEFKVNNNYVGIIDGYSSNVYLGKGTGGDSTVLNSVASQNVAIGWEAFASIPSTTNLSGIDAIGYDALHFDVSGIDENAVGAFALYNVNTGSYNDALGYAAGFNITTGSYNTSVGYLAQYGQQTGAYTVAVGDSALFGASLGSTASTPYYSNANTAVGVNALGAVAGTSSPLTGSYNTSMGYEAGRHVTTGNYNSSFGYQANYNVRTGFGNVAVGANALFKNTYSGNTAVGVNALYNNNIGSVANGPNTAVGDSAMYANTTGVKNVAVGYGALAAPTVANNNVAIGYDAMMPTLATGTVSNNVDIGWLAGQLYTSQSNNVAVGAGAMEGLAANAASNPSQDVAIGAFALANAGTGANYDIAIGAGSSSSTGPLGGGGASFTGAGDIAIGYESGNITAIMTTGSNNTYLGYGTYGATTQTQNVAIGYSAHAASTTASQASNDVAIGYNANAYGAATTTNATAIGASSQATVANSTAIGYSATTTSGASATAIGASATAQGANATSIGPGATAPTANTVVIGNAANVNGASQTNVGVGTTAPARELEIAGSTNTIRVDGLASGASFNVTPATTTSNLLYSLGSTGDIYSLPNTGATAGQVITLNASGYPYWATASALPTATAPLVVTGSVLSLQGANGTVLIGTGTGSTFFGAGPVGDVLEGQGTGNPPIWTTITSIAGTGDNWGSQVAITDSNASSAAENTITGDGLSTSPLRLAKQGATNNQVLAWNTAANTWKPINANTTLTTNNILGGTAVVITNGTGQVVGASNVTVDVQGTAGGVLYGKGAGVSALFTPAGTTGQILTSAGAGAPTWTTLAPANGWSLTGNSGTIPGTNFLGTTSFASLVFDVNGAYAGSLDPLNTSASAGNVYLGAPSTVTPILNGAGNKDAGDNNVAIGLAALASAGGPSYVGGNAANTTGSITSNVAVGAYALSSAVYGGQNTAVGAWSQRLLNATAANTNTFNTSLGAYSLYSNSTGKFNTSTGAYSMYGSGTATAVGYYNTAEGYQALYTAGAGIASNTAIGSNALYSTTASKNTAVGDSALYSNTSGTYNTAVGYGANVSAGNLTNATAIGAYALAAQSNTIVLGQISGVGQGTINTNVGIGTNTPDVDAGLAIKTLHIETQPGSTSTTASNTGTGVSGAAVTGTDVGGNIGFSVTGGTLGAQVTVNFATAYVNAPTVILTPANSAAGTAVGANKPYITSTTTGFVINFTTGGTASGLLFNYFVIETQ